MTDSNNLLIKNVRVLCNDCLIRNKDILIENGKIKDIKSEININNYDRILYANNYIGIPAAIDINAHFGNQKYEYKEDWYSGSCSAAFGGITTVIDQPDINSITNNKISFQNKLNLARKKSIVDYGINCSIYNNIDKIKELYQLGSIGFVDLFTEYNNNNNINLLEYKNIINYIKEYKTVFIIHPENKNIINKNKILLNYNISSDPEYYTKMKSESSEYIQIIELLKIINCFKNSSVHFHFSSISTQQSLELINYTKKIYHNISFSVTPHHMLLNTSHYHKFKNLVKTNPPIRDKYVSQYLINNLNNIDIITSNHSPHLIEEKDVNNSYIPDGIPGIETLVPLMLMFVKRNYISLKKLIELLCINPAKIFNIKSKGYLLKNYDADIILFDPKKITNIKCDDLHYKCAWTPFENMNAIFPEVVISRGSIIIKDKQIICKRGRGTMINENCKCKKID